MRTELLQDCLRFLDLRTTCSARTSLKPLQLVQLALLVVPVDFDNKPDLLAVVAE